MKAGKISDNEILATANKKLCYRPKLQVAYDRLLIASAHGQSISGLWENYLRHGGDRTMVDDGVDHNNWKRVDLKSKAATSRTAQS